MDIFLGTLIDAGLIVAGSLIGLPFRKVTKLKSIGERTFQTFALFVMVMGIKGVSLDQPLYLLLCVMFGTIIGEAIDLDRQVTRFANWVQEKATKGNSAHFAQGFVEATLLFCIGSMTFLGAMESGIQHEHSIYIAKGIIDGVSAISLTMVCGVSVIFSAVSVLFYQGLLTIGAGALSGILTTETVNMCVSVGSLSLIAISLNMLKLTKIKVANFLPAMFLPMVWQAIQLLLHS